MMKYYIIALLVVASCIVGNDGQVAPSQKAPLLDPIPLPSGPALPPSHSGEDPFVRLDEVMHAIQKGYTEIINCDQVAQKKLTKKGAVDRLYSLVLVNLKDTLLLTLSIMRGFDAQGMGKVPGKEQIAQTIGNFATAIENIPAQNKEIYSKICTLSNKAHKLCDEKRRELYIEMATVLNSFSNRLESMLTGFRIAIARVMIGLSNGNISSKDANLINTSLAEVTINYLAEFKKTSGPLHRILDKFF